MIARKLRSTGITDVYQWAIAALVLGSMLAGCRHTDYAVFETCVSHGGTDELIRAYLEHHPELEERFRIAAQARKVAVGMPWECVEVVAGNSLQRVSAHKFRLRYQVKNRLVLQLPYPEWDSRRAYLYLDEPLGLHEALEEKLAAIIIKGDYTLYP